MSGALKRKLKGKRPPEGWELIEEVIEDFETQLKDAVNEDHEGKRVKEMTWKIHRLHWEKNRFIFDLMYQRKVMSKELVRAARGGLAAEGCACAHKLHMHWAHVHCACTPMRPAEMRAPEQRDTLYILVLPCSCLYAFG